MFREIFEESGFEVYESRESFIEYVQIEQQEFIVYNYIFKISFYFVLKKNKLHPTKKIFILLKLNRFDSSLLCWCLNFINHQNH